MKKHDGAGYLWEIQDHSGKLAESIFLEVEDLGEGIRYGKVIEQFSKAINGKYHRKKYSVEMYPVFDLGSLEGKLSRSMPARFPIELFLDGKGKMNRPMVARILDALKEKKDDYLPTLTTGAVARGDDFYDREQFIDDIWQTLDNGNIILTAPRRYGKTSLLYHLLDHPRSAFCPVHIDLEGVSEPSSFYVEIVMALRRSEGFSDCMSLTDILGGTFEGMNEVDTCDIRERLNEESRDNWKDKLGLLFRSLEREKNRVLFLWDEFSFMLENFLLTGRKKEAAEIINGLCSVLPEMKRSRLILTGSIFLKRLLLDIPCKHKEEFNSFFEEKRLPPLGADKAFELAALLLTGAGIRPKKEVVESILGLVGSPIPFFIQLLILEIEKGLKREGIEITPENIRRIYYQRILGPDCKIYFRHYYEHLRHLTLGNWSVMPGLKYLFDELTHRERLSLMEMKALLQAKLSRLPDEDISRVLDILEDEFYVVNEEGGYTFSSNVLRDWWNRNHQYFDEKGA